MSTPATPTSAGFDLSALDAITEAVESGAGLPEVVRAAARALDASLALIDRSSAVLAVAARSPADEQRLLAGGEGIETHELRVADTVVGQLRMQARSEPSPAVTRLVLTLVASEVERVRGPERASEEAAADFVSALLRGEPADDLDAIVARGRELGIDVENGGCVVVARAHPLALTEDGWRARFLAVAQRGARAALPGSVAVPGGRHDSLDAEAVVLLPGADEEAGARAAEAILRELHAALSGFGFAVGRSRQATAPGELARSANEALLAANVAEGHADREALAFEETGAYRLLLSAMSEDPAELQRFYAETVEPLVAYDGQYDTELVKTLEAFLEADGNVAGTAQRLFTHRHTIRYRLERVRDLSGLDVASSDGREKLSLGLKAMRVLGIAAPGGPSSEPGSTGGRVPRSGANR
ncbi:MAG TPA: helix-turn-helix domain-containing protein [Capillimicrobium sp.]|nr:helix-turn-helix domain-containing protein [Capillimicrobium sp.]